MSSCVASNFSGSLGVGVPAGSPGGMPRGAGGNFLKNGKIVLEKGKNRKFVFWKFASEGAQFKRKFSKRDENL